MNALYPAPAADFHHPLEMLAACHERIRRQCALIERIADHLERNGADLQARDAARAVIRYFDTAGRHHHRDEEDDLFPALVQSARGAARPALEALVARLAGDHADLDTRWNDMRATLLELADGRDVQLERTAARAFACAYERHIDLEETQLLPLARELLDESHAARLGASMAGRRGVAIPAS